MITDEVIVWPSASRSPPQRATCLLWDIGGEPANPDDDDDDQFSLSTASYTIGPVLQSPSTMSQNYTTAQLSGIKY